MRSAIRNIPLVILICVHAITAYAAAYPYAEEFDRQEQMDSFDQKNVSYYYNLAKRSILKGKYQEALAAIHKGQALDPTYLPFMKQKALVFINLGRRNDAAQVINLARGGLPDDLELNALLVDNMLAQAPDRRAAATELTRYFKQLNPRIAPALIANIASSSSRHDSRFETVLSSVVAANILQQPDQAVLLACLNKKPAEAVALLNKNATPAADDPLHGTLALLVAEAYQRARDYSTADMFYKKAIAQGYDAEKAYWIKGQIYFDLHNADGAAQTFEEYWRSADNPGIWVVLAAKAYVELGKYDRAIAILRQAARVSPNDPYVQGHLYYSLAASGDHAQADSYAKKLKDEGQVMAGEYGKFLYARSIKNDEASDLASAAFMKAANNITYVHDQPSVRRIMDDLDFASATSPLQRQASLLRIAGWDMWNKNRYQEAFIYWKNSESLGSDDSKTFWPGMCRALLQQNMVAEAEEIFHLQYPDTPFMYFAFTLVRQEQWYAAQPLLDAVSPQNTAILPWYMLIKALSVAKNGTPAEVAASADQLIGSSVPATNTSIEIPGQTGVFEKISLNKSYYQSLLKQYFETLSQQGYGSLFPGLIASRQFLSLPSNDQLLLLSNAALDLSVKGGEKDAEPLWRAAYAINPQLPEVNLGMALVDSMHGGQNVDEFLHKGLASGSQKREYILGRIKMLGGQNEQAAQHFTIYLQKEPKNFEARFMLFRLYMSMPSYHKARDIQTFFKNNGSEPGALMYLGRCEMAFGEFAKAEKVFRLLLSRQLGHAPTVLALVEALRAQERNDEALALLAANNLEDPEILTVLRAKTEKAMRSGLWPEARLVASKYLELSPDSIYMNGLFNSSLREQYRQEATEIQNVKYDKMLFDKGKLNVDYISPQRLQQLRGMTAAEAEALAPDETLLAQAEEQNAALLQRNNIQKNALESSLDIAMQKEDFERASELSSFLAKQYPFDQHYRVQSAVHMGSQAQFKRALPIVQKLSAQGVNSPGMALYFVNLSEAPRGDVCTPQDIAYYLKELDEQFRSVSLTQFLSQRGDSKKNLADKIPLLLVIGQSSPAVLDAIDAILTHYNAKAVLLVSKQSFIAGTPGNTPNTEDLRRLAATGRWDFALGDTMYKTVITDAAGRIGNFWAGRAQVGGRPETRDEMYTRWSGALAEIKKAALDKGFDLRTWIYPGGDYGQLNLDGSEDIRQAYTQAVKAQFNVAMVPSSNGYHAADMDPLFLPVRNVYGPMDTETLASLAQGHPTRRAVLTEALLDSWHGQIARAEQLLGRASDLGLSPKDTSYYRANNAVYDGDAAYANELARKARAWDPGNLRTRQLLERAEHMLRPRISFLPRWWNDNEGRQYAEYTVNASEFVREDLSVSAFVSDLSWKHESDITRGQAAGVSMRYYPFKQHWLDVMVRGIQKEGGNTMAAWSAAWRGAYATDLLRANGNYTITYSRDTLETQESINNGTFADQIFINSETRFFDWTVLETEFFGISRTDGNKTIGATLNPSYIIFDKPHLRVGYLFSAADSDRNPQEYYAPQQYTNHMAVVSAGYEIVPGFSLQGMVGYGTARSKDKDWEKVFRYSVGLDWSMTEDWRLRFKYQRLELPTYNMDQFTLGIQYVF